MEWVKKLFQKYSRKSKKEDESNRYLSSMEPDRRQGAR